MCFGTWVGEDRELVCARSNRDAYGRTVDAESAFSDRNRYFGLYLALMVGGWVAFLILSFSIKEFVPSRVCGVSLLLICTIHLFPTFFQRNIYIGFGFHDTYLLVCVYSLDIGGISLYVHGWDGRFLDVSTDGIGGTVLI